MKNGFSIDVEELELGARECLGLPLTASSEFLSEQTDRMLALLRECGVRATFFVNGRSAELHPGLVKRIFDDGHEIGAHSYAHQFLDRFRDGDEFRRDLERCVEWIERETGVRPIGYRAPGYSLYPRREMAIAVLAELGFRYDSSVLSVGDRRQHHYTRGPDRVFRWKNGILELPMPSTRFCGMQVPIFGSYALRLLPYRITASGLRRLNAGGRPGFMYVHSFELFHNPVSREVRLVNFPRQWIWLMRRGAQMERKVRRLFSEFTFVPFREFLDMSAPEMSPEFH